MSKNRTGDEAFVVPQEVVFSRQLLSGMSKWEITVELRGGDLYATLSLLVTQRVAKRTLDNRNTFLSSPQVRA